MKTKTGDAYIKLLSSPELALRLSAIKAIEQTEPDEAVGGVVQPVNGR